MRMLNLSSSAIADMGALNPATIGAMLLPAAVVIGVLVAVSTWWLRAVKTR